MFRKGMYLSEFYCLCYEMDIYTDMSEYQVSEERYLDLNEEEDITMDGGRERLVSIFKRQSSGTPPPPQCYIYPLPS